MKDLAIIILIFISVMAIGVVCSSEDLHNEEMRLKQQEIENLKDEIDYYRNDNRYKAVQKCDSNETLPFFTECVMWELTK